MGDAAMTLPDNPLGLHRFDALVDWTVSYLHFKHALEVIAFTPETATPYLCLLYTSPSPRDGLLSRMPSSA